MKRLLLILALVGFICGAGSQTFSMGMPKKISDEVVVETYNISGKLIDVTSPPMTTYEATTSLIFGGQIGYNSMGGGKMGFSIVTGLSYPVSSRLYALSLSEMGKVQDDKSYSVGGGFIYYLHPPGTTWLNIALMSRAESKWKQDETGDIIGSYLSGVGGLIFTFPFDEYWGGWISLEVKKDVNIVEYRAVLGLVSFL